MADNDFDIREFEKQLRMTIYPRKPVYRHVEWRNGHKVYERVGYKSPLISSKGKRLGGYKFIPMRKNSYLGLQMETGDPEKFKRDRKILRWSRVQNRWTMWFDREKGFWKGVFGL